MSNHLLALAIKPVDFARSIGGGVALRNSLQAQGQQSELRGLKIEGLKQGVADNALMRAARVDAFDVFQGGTPEQQRAAIMRLGELDPKEAASIQQLVANADDRQRAALAEMSEDLARAAMFADTGEVGRRGGSSFREISRCGQTQRAVLSRGPAQGDSERDEPSRRNCRGAAHPVQRFPAQWSGPDAARVHPWRQSRPGDHPGPGGGQGPALHPTCARPLGREDGPGRNPDACGGADHQSVQADRSFAANPRRCSRGAGPRR